MSRQCRGKEGRKLDEESTLASGICRAMTFAATARVRRDFTSRLLALEDEADDEQQVRNARLDGTVADAVLADVTGGKFDDAMHEQQQGRVKQREAEDHEDG
jgi:hypothetical protein